MSYDAMELGLLTVIRLHANYDANNSSQGDYRILGGGKTRAVVLNPGPFRAGVTMGNRYISTDWEIVVSLFILYRTDVPTTRKAIRDDRETLMDHINSYPTLNGTSNARNVLLTSGQQPEIWRMDDEAQWWMQTMSVAVTEGKTVSNAE